MKFLWQSQRVELYVAGPVKPDPLKGPRSLSHSPDHPPSPLAARVREARELVSLTLVISPLTPSLRLTTQPRPASHPPPPLSLASRCQREDARAPRRQTEHVDPMPCSPPIAPTTMTDRANIPFPTLALGSIRE